MIEEFTYRGATVIDCAEYQPFTALEITAERKRRQEAKARSEFYIALHRNGTIDRYMAAFRQAYKEGAR